MIPADGAASIPAPASRPPGSSDPGPARVLVVDDEPGIREGCRRILAADGYETVTARDGEEALTHLCGPQPFAALLVDLQMPRMSGIELMKEARKRDPDILSVIITAHATIDSAVEGTRQGAYSYLPKPFTPDELRLTIRNGLVLRALGLEARRLRDERERRLLELASERSRSNTILTALTNGILVINRERLVVLRNDAAARILPDCAAREIPFPLEAVPIPDLRECIETVLSTPEGFVILSRQIDLGASTYMVNVGPVIEPDGGTSGAVAAFSDVTELKKLDAAKSTFVSMVAHEVKSPLAAAEGWLNVVLSGMPRHDEVEQRRMLERAQLRLRTLRAMVNELLSLTAIQTGKFELTRSAIDAAPAVSEAVESCRALAADRQVELTMDTPGSDCLSLLADREAFVVICRNLLENAVKYSRHGGHVRVRVGREGPFVSVSVADEGIGIPPEELDRIFDEFYRVRSEQTADIPGTGLGLSLVKRLTELHEGTVTVTSTPGTGSEFTVRIPGVSAVASP